jgi:hypothetical protein
MFASTGTYRISYEDMNLIQLAQDHILLQVLVVVVLKLWALLSVVELVNELAT